MSCYRAAPVYQDLEAGLRDMVKGLRLKEEDIPDDWEWLTVVLSRIERMRTEMDSAAIAAAEFARSKYLSLASDDIEIDELPATSKADDGTWVNAWLWVYDEEVRQ